MSVISNKSENKWRMVRKIQVEEIINGSKWLNFNAFDACVHW